MANRKRPQLIDTTWIPGADSELQLMLHDDTYTIRIAGVPGDLMSSRAHSSEDELGRLSCQYLQKTANASVLIGGLGMGFTLAAALDSLSSDASIIVAELVPGVVEWNLAQLGRCADYPLKDPRVVVRSEDVWNLIDPAVGEFDAIVLDVDNGPEALTHPHNDQLYSLSGLQRAHRALRSQGQIGVWSATSSEAFSNRLEAAGFDVTVKQVREHKGKGARHTIWLGRKPA